MLRSIVSVGMNITGMFIVFAAMVVPDASRNLHLQVILALIGVLMIQAAVWKFANPFLPSERRFDELRNEVDDFIELVRDLNEVAIAARETHSLEDTGRVEHVLAEMHRSVDQMGRLAGREVSFAYLPEPLESIAFNPGFPPGATTEPQAQPTFVDDVRPPENEQWPAPAMDSAQ